MTTIRWLKPEDPPEALPDPSLALRDPNGLLAVGGSLSPEWLLHCYAHGVFPWYEAGQPILWWSPDPRAVLVPDGIHVSRSLGRSLRRPGLTVTCDTAFEAVVSGCAAPRGYTDKTWITSEMAAAYLRLHELGWAHSFEVWLDAELVGGLYGVAIGRVFCGESMFARQRDASKVALVHCCRFLAGRGFELIDCQVPSEHLLRLGAATLPRDRFLEHLATLTADPGRPETWTSAFAPRPRCDTA